MVDDNPQVTDMPPLMAAVPDPVASLMADGTSGLPPTPAAPLAPQSVPLSSSDWNQMFASTAFVSYLQDRVLQFLNIIDIESTGQRRDALVALKLDESAILDRFKVAGAFIRLQKEYASWAKNDILAAEVISLTSKHAAMRQWLTM